MIVYKTRQEMEKMDAANRIVQTTLRRLAESVRPGMTTHDFEEIAARCIGESGARPAFKGYRGYPCCLCVSINDEVVHGIPSKKKVLAEGDIVSFDFGVVWDGYYGDGAITVPVGRVSREAERLMRVTEESLQAGIEQMQPGKRLSDIGHAIQKHVEAHGFGVVRDFVGHGIGTALHEEPQVPNYGAPGRGPVLEPGMVLAIEPMVTARGHEVMVQDDGWTAVTRDGSLAAHFELSVAITDEGPWTLGLERR